VRPSIKLSAARVLAAAAVAVLLAGPASSQDAPESQPEAPKFPTTVFAPDADRATVTVDDLSATVTVVAPSDPESGALPVLTVEVDGIKVAEATGAETDFDLQSAQASIAPMDPDSDRPAIYFASFSGGAHCCTTVIVVEQVGEGWIVIPVGDFDGDGDYLDDLDGDGFAEVVTVDNRFLYQFDSYAASAAPLVIYTIRKGEVVDASTELRFLPAHRDWLARLEESAPEDRWTSRGYLAGWLAEKIRLGEGAAAWQELNANWDLAADTGEEICTSDAELEDCAAADLKTVKFPEQLQIFLKKNGYSL
jgi:hypothetical protein